MAFDVITPAKLTNEEMSLTLRTVYTAPADTRVFVKDINIANPNASSAIISVYLVDAGDTAGVSNALLGSVEVLGNDAAQWSGSQILDENDTIQAISDTANLCIKISGGEATS